MKAVKAQPERRVITKAHDVPGLIPRIDVPAPREGLVGDSHPSPASALGQLVELIRNPRRIVEGVPGYRGADQHRVGAEVFHHCELVLGPAQVCGEPVGQHRVEIAERLVEVDRKPEVSATLAHFRRCRRRCDEVVLKYLDSIEAGPRDRVEFVFQHPRQANGGNCSSDAAIVTKWCRHPRTLQCAVAVITLFRLREAR